MPKHYILDHKVSVTHGEQFHAYHGDQETNEKQKYQRLTCDSCGVVI